MKNKKKNITKEFLKRNLLKKYELKRVILKSIFQNRNTNLKNRIYAYKKTIKQHKFSYLSSQKNLCLFSGKYKSTWKFVNFSRHTTKKLNLVGDIAGLRKRSW